MSELPEDDPRVEKTLAVLMTRMTVFIGYPLTETTINSIRTLVQHTRSDFKANFGHEFPAIAPLILPRSQFIAWFRQDLDSDEVRIKVLNLLREFYVKRIPVSAFELAQAMKLIWPQYEPPLEYYRNAKQVRLLQ